MLGGVCIKSEMTNKDHVQLPPPGRQDMVDWVKKPFNYISNSTQLVNRCNRQ